MEDIDFQPVTLSDQDLISGYLTRYESRSCERTFACTYLWGRRFPVTFAIVCDTLVFKSEDEKHLSFTFPAGADADVIRALDALQDYSRRRERPFCLYMVTEENFDRLSAWYPDRFQIEYNRNLADYIYEAEKLDTLSGKALHGKRNHIHQFENAYAGRWVYEPLTGENLEDCFTMAQIWRRQNGCDEDPEKNAEMCTTLNALRLFDELHLSGGLIRLDQDVVAFTIGERLSSDTFVVHFEKAFSDIPGAYPLINQQFVHHACGSYTYVNREEDTGSEGLRKAKLSYHPAFLVEKGFVTVKER